MLRTSKLFVYQYDCGGTITISVKVLAFSGIRGDVSERGARRGLDKDTKTKGPYSICIFILVCRTGKA